MNMLLTIMNATQLVWANMLQVTNATQVTDFTMNSGCYSAPEPLLWQLLSWSTTDWTSSRSVPMLGSILGYSYACALSSSSLETTLPKCEWFYALLALLILRVVLACVIRLYRAFTASRVAPNTPQDDRRPPTTLRRSQRRHRALR